MKTIQEWKQRIKLCWVILTNTDGNLVGHFKSELPHLGEDNVDGWMADSLVNLARVFSAEGHSGASAGWAIGAFNTLAKFEPLGPLTGEEGEWNICGYSDELHEQNKRCGRVFRRSDGTAYDIDAVVFVEPDGSSYTSSESLLNVQFPYTPSTIYVEVPEDADGNQRIDAIREQRGEA